MSALAWLAAAGGVSSLAMGFVIWAMKIRIGGLKADAQYTYTLLKAAEAALKVATTEFDQYRLRAEAKEAALVAELVRFQEEELDGIEKEPDRAVRIRRRRNWVGDVLSQASNPTGDNSDRGVREGTTP